MTAEPVSSTPQQPYPHDELRDLYHDFMGVVCDAEVGERSRPQRSGKETPEAVRRRLRREQFASKLERLAFGVNTGKHTFLPAARPSARG
ncbi:hypothetical protein [Candidatus Poriferisodalis sp.]|uniref:hypothetical protein n=1 Tax=Candidatus Poriferisodalis sp. TaxID=3101277 RepID=UPI003B014408